MHKHRQSIEVYLSQFWHRYSDFRKDGNAEQRQMLENEGSLNCGRVAQLREHLLCKHAFISPKSLNRRHFTVQIPLQVGLPVGLQKIRALCDPLKHGGPDARRSIRSVSLRAVRGFLE